MNIQEQLIRDEGFLPTAYQDSLGFWTIGVGRLIDHRKGGGITRQEALYLLDNDISQKSTELRKALPWVDRLDEARFGVLLNMAFNLGVPGLLKFKNTLAHVAAGAYDMAAVEMLDSTWAKQVGPRAKRLSKQMETGEWQ